jgi:hypothetical protein
MKITVYLNEEEAKALAQLAKNEIRDPRSQVYLLIRKELESKGLLQADQGLANQKQNESVQASNVKSS